MFFEFTIASFGGLLNKCSTVLCSFFISLSAVGWNCTDCRTCAIYWLGRGWSWPQCRPKVSDQVPSRFFSYGGLAGRYADSNEAMEAALNFIWQEHERLGPGWVWIQIMQSGWRWITGSKMASKMAQVLGWPVMQRDRVVFTAQCKMSYCMFVCLCGVCWSILFSYMLQL